MEQSISIDEMTGPKSEPVGVEVEEKLIRIMTGTVSPEIRERFMTVQAKWFLKFRERVSVQALVDDALFRGLELLEREVVDVAE